MRNERLFFIAHRRRVINLCCLSRLSRQLEQGGERGDRNAVCSLHIWEVKSAATLLMQADACFRHKFLSIVFWIHVARNQLDIVQRSYAARASSYAFLCVLQVLYYLTSTLRMRQRSRILFAFNIFSPSNKSN